jgi:hypothetical protein
LAYLINAVCSNLQQIQLNNNMSVGRKCLSRVEMTLSNKISSFLWYRVNITAHFRIIIFIEGSTKMGATTLSIMALSNNDIQHTDAQHKWNSAWQYYCYGVSLCSMLLFVIMLRVMLSVIILSVIMLSVIMLSVIMLSVIILSVDFYLLFGSV